MGNLFRKIFNYHRINKEIRLVLIGLDNVGKTTILYKLKDNQTIVTIPTIGFNLETIQFQNISFQCFDIGGGHKIKEIWPQYFNNMTGIVYIIDSSSDYKQLEIAKYWLYKLLNEEVTQNSPILILANKQDKTEYSIQDIEQVFNLNVTNRQWKIQFCCALNGQGLNEGLQWLVNYYNNNTNQI